MTMTTSFPTSNVWVSALLLLSGSRAVVGYVGSATSSTLPSTMAPWKPTNPFQIQGLDVELPDFSKLFHDIQKVSPLARAVISGENHRSEYKGLERIDEKVPDQLKWKRVESGTKGRHPVHRIDRLDGFNGHSAPMLRFRASMDGPCVGEYFGKFIIDLEERKKWDAQINDVYEIHPLTDLDAANIAMGFGRYGDCSRLGVGYCQTKAALGVTPREQLFLYGLQEFAHDGSVMLWGQEMDRKYDNLLPPKSRDTRAKSHLFAATMTPTGNEKFDIEYALQLDIGGNIPTWLTTPVMVDTVKNLFSTVQKEFLNPCNTVLQSILQQKKQQHSLTDRHSLLMTP